MVPLRKDTTSGLRILGFASFMGSLLDVSCGTPLVLLTPTTDAHTVAHQPSKSSIERQNNPVAAAVRACCPNAGARLCRSPPTSRSNMRNCHILRIHDSRRSAHVHHFPLFAFGQHARHEAQTSFGLSPSTLNSHPRPILLPVRKDFAADYEPRSLTLDAAGGIVPNQEQSKTIWFEVQSAHET
jgi:hypothetical protein